MGKLLQTYNNGTVEAWKVGSHTIIPYPIVEKIRQKHIELLNEEEGVKAKIVDKIILLGDWVILENGKFTTLSDEEFHKKYSQDFEE